MHSNIDITSFANKVGYQFLKTLWTIRVMCLKKSCDQKSLLKISESERI